jgi:CheY-like chemotaxis protein
MEKESLSEHSNSTQIRVLHVDDEPADLEITRIFLKREEKDDFEIVSVLSAEEALEKLESEHFDAVIADYKMPEMDGIEFLEVVRKSGKYAHTPFILFTGKGSPEVAEEALKKGADRYISKAGNPASQCNELAHAISELVSDREGEMREYDLWESDRDKRPSKVVVRSSQCQSL